MYTQDFVKELTSPGVAFRDRLLLLLVLLLLLPRLLLLLPLLLLLHLLLLLLRRRRWESFLEGHFWIANIKLESPFLTLRK